MQPEEQVHVVDGRAGSPFEQGVHYGCHLQTAVVLVQVDEAFVGAFHFLGTGLGAVGDEHEIVVVVELLIHPYQRADVVGRGQRHAAGDGAVVLGSGVGNRDFLAEGGMQFPDGVGYVGCQFLRLDLRRLVDARGRHLDVDLVVDDLVLGQRQQGQDRDGGFRQRYDCALGAPYQHLAVQLRQPIGEAVFLRRVGVLHVHTHVDDAQVVGDHPVGEPFDGLSLVAEYEEHVDRVEVDNRGDSHGGLA